jgi:hypothetical protein
MLPSQNDIKSKQKSIFRWCLPLGMRRKHQAWPTRIKDDKLRLEEDVAINGQAQALVRLQATKTI